MREGSSFRSTQGGATIRVFKSLSPSSAAVCTSQSINLDDISMTRWRSAVPRTMMSPPRSTPPPCLLSGAAAGRRAPPRPSAPTPCPPPRSPRISPAPNGCSILWRLCMSMGMYTCVCVCMYVCLFVCPYVCVCVNECMHVCMCACIYAEF